MTWWNVSGLTPVAAWDGRGFERAGGVNRIVDRVGTNHLLNVGWKTRNQDFVAIAGSGNPLPFTSTITFPTNFVVAVFARQTSATTYFYSELATSSFYMLDHDGAAGIAAGSTATAATTIQTGSPNINVDLFSAFAVTPSGGRVYSKSTFFPTVVPPARIATYAKGVGWLANGNTNNVKVGDFVFGMGVWAGTADATQLATIGSQLKAYVSEPITAYHRPGVMYPRRFNPLAQAGGAKTRATTAVRLAKRSAFFGLLTITGRVIEDGVSACKEVRIYERKTHICRGSTWSDSVTGNYAFTLLDEKLEYYVLSFDDKGARPAQIRDRIVASG